MKPTRLLFATTLALALARPAVAADKTTIKLATLVPEGSVMHQILRDMGADWTKSTGGRVALTIYPGGVAGDEPDVVRKLRIGQLQASTLTLGGLAQLEDGFRAFNIPLFFDSTAELFSVVKTVTPTFRERLDAKGYVLLHWGHAGWIHLFSTKPIKTIGDLKKQKLFVWAGDDQLVQWWKKNGFQPVALAATDVLTGLQTGMIDAMPATPIAALSLQWFRATPNMLDLGFGPLVGATVVSKKTWEKLSPEDQKALLAAAQRAQGRLETEVPAQDAKAIEEMKKRGLIVNPVVDAPEWRKAADAMVVSTRADVVDSPTYEAVIKARDEYRSRAAKPAAASPKPHR